MAAVHSHILGCPGYIAAEFGEFMKNELALVSVRRGFERGKTEAGRGSLVRDAEIRQIVGADLLLRVHYDHALDRILQFANIARPEVALQFLDSILGKDLSFLTVITREAVIEMLDQQRHVLDPFAKRRHLERDDVQAV